MEKKYERIIAFKISGKFAHYKKFYSNKSSLTYKIPPRSVIMGIIASVMEEERDSYYAWLSLEKSFISLNVVKNGTTQFQCMNYIYNEDGHTQVRLELMKGNPLLEYIVYFGCEDTEKLTLFEEKIKKHHLGYGVYLGQRQFKAYIEFVDMFKTGNKIIDDFIGELSSCTFRDNIKEHETDGKIIMDRMPVAFQRDIKGRLSEKKEDVIYTENGEKITGRFKKVLSIGNINISDYSV